MKRKVMFINIILIIFLIILLILPNYSNADGLSWSEMQSQAKGFINKGEKSYSLDESKLQGIIIPIAQILVAIGNVIVVIALTVIGIKYMMANPEQKAKLKSQLVGVVIATMVIFGAQLIWSILYNFLSTSI
ncbi:MAG: hypothetical protein HFJ40_07180 [Clostridia bacterium]|nr:hypothetical protein [Clostridia bacterium]